MVLDIDHIITTTARKAKKTQPEAKDNVQKDHPVDSLVGYISH